MSRRADMQWSIALVIVLLISNVSSQFQGTLFTDSYDLRHENNSFIAINPNTGRWRAVAGYARSIDAVEGTSAPEKGLYFMGTSMGDMFHIDFVNASTGAQTGGITADVTTLSNIQYDSSTGLVYGVCLTDVAFDIVSLNLDTGKTRIIASLPDTYSLYLDASAIDVKNRKYYSMIGDDQDRDALLVVDISAHNSTRLIFVKDVLTPITFFTSSCLLGHNLTNVVCLDPSNGKMSNIVPHLYGLPVFGGLAASSENGGTLFAATVADLKYWTVVHELKTGKEIARYNLYDGGVHFLQYFPSIKPS